MTAVSGSRPSEPLQKTLPTTAASWRSSFSSAFEAVEAGGDDSLQRLGQWEVVRGASFDVELGELLRIQRIATRVLEQLLLRVCEHGACEQTADERRRLRVRQG